MLDLVASVIIFQTPTGPYKILHQLSGCIGKNISASYIIKWWHSQLESDGADGIANIHTVLPENDHKKY